tara:strand:- start:6592 stop:7125 length:534 start_codon:yes stop_codon:yes gene_type:complete
VGLIVNSGTAFLFYKDQKSNLNIKGAFLHMAADAGVTLGVLLGGLAIKYTGVTWIDPLLGLVIVIVIVIVIVYGAWGLLSDSIKLAHDAVPEGINLEEVKEFLENIEGVDNVHDLHIWAMSTTETALTAHLVMPGGYKDQLLYDIREKLHEEYEITHTTLQVEREWSDEQYQPYKNE